MFSYNMVRTRNIPWNNDDVSNVISWIFIVLAHWNYSLRVDMSLHSDTLSRFQSIQVLLLLLNAACLAEKQQMLIL